MGNRVAAAFVACLAGACSDMPSTLPTGPTEVSLQASTSGPTGPGLVMRTERWVLELAVLDIAGLDCADAGLRAVRQVDLTIEFRDNGAVTMAYDDHSRAANAAEWTGWLLQNGLEASGEAREGLPCSGAADEPDGAPSTLTGYFSADGGTFTAMEIRRYMGRDAGELVYYLTWTAERVR